MRRSTRANRFWKRLAQNYGARLAEQFGASPPDDWCQVIDSTDDNRLEAALIKVRQAHPKWPPTLGEFEAIIPRRDRFSGESIPDRLARAATARFRMCRHQLCSPWSYFGTDAQHSPENHVTAGVVVPQCCHEGCENYGKPGFRLSAEDLAA